jgi:hypothetical protein
MNNLLSENKNITEYQNIKGLMRVWEKQGKSKKISFFLVVTIIFHNIATSNLT